MEGHYAVPQQREPICGAQNLAEPCRTYSTGTVKVITLSNAGSPAQPRGNPGQHGGIPVIGTPRLPNVRGNLKKVRQYQLRKQGDINLIFAIVFSEEGLVINEQEQQLGSSWRSNRVLKGHSQPCKSQRSKHSQFAQSDGSQTRDRAQTKGRVDWP